MPLHAYRQRLKSQIQEKCVHGRLDRAEVSHQLGSRLGNISTLQAELFRVGDPVIGLIRRGKTREFVLVGHPVESAGVHDTAAYSRVMAVHIFGCGMRHDIRAPLDRPAVDRSREGIVNNQRNPVGMGCLRETFNIKNDQCRIRQGLPEDCFCVGTEGIFQFFVAAVRVNECEIDSHPAHGDIEKIIASSVYAGRGNNMVAGSGKIKYGEKGRSLSGTGQHRRASAFQSRDLRRHHVVRRVLQPGIEISACLQVKQLPHVFAGIILKSCALDNRNHPGFPVFRRVAGFYAFRLFSHARLLPKQSFVT